MHSEDITKLTVFDYGLIAVVNGKVSTDLEIIICLGRLTFVIVVLMHVKTGTSRHCVVTVVISSSHIALCTV